MQVLVAVLQLFPALVEVIKAIETVFPQSGIGKEKKALIVSIMTEIHSEITSMLPAIEVVIDGIVSFANKIGEFKKSK